LEPQSSRRVFHGKFLQVDVEQWPAGEREVVKHPRACAVVPITPQGDVLLVRQLREAVREELVEIPAGILEDGESTAACAARELLEETGYRATKLQHLSTVYTTPGFTDERIELFRATAEPIGDPSEEAVRVVTMPLSEALAAIERGDIIDAKTISGLLLAVRAHRVLPPGSDTADS
jgi:ADP-ribose pyrophosphatase